MAVDGQGQLYVADRSSREVLLYSSEGRFNSTLRLPAEAGALNPLGVSFDRSGNLLLTDTGAETHQVVIVDRGGKLVRRFGRLGDQPGDLQFPNQAAADSRGRIYVSNGNLGRVEIFGPEGGHLGAVAPGGSLRTFGLPRGVAVDHLDRLYAVDSSNGVVQVFDVSGDKPGYLYSIGAEGDGNGQLRFPGQVAVDASGRVYVADRVNHRVQVWSY
jgi:sugar lactone lactonase YvrE